MESFFGVEEDEAEAELEDAASMAAFVRANKEERAKDAKSKSLAVSKEVVESEEVDVEGDELEETDSVVSTSSQPTKTKTRPKGFQSKKYPPKCLLSQVSKEVVESEEVDVEGDELEETDSVVSTSSQPTKTKTRPKGFQSKKYPTKCLLSQAQLFYPTSAESLHETGVDVTPSTSVLERIYPNTRVSTAVSLRIVSMGLKLGVTLTPTYVEFTWAQHLVVVSALPSLGGRQGHGPTTWTACIPIRLSMRMFSLPSGPLEGVKIEPELFIEQESFTIPVPKSKSSSKGDEPSTKRPKREPTSLLSYDDWEQASKEGELYLLADSPNPNQPRPKAAAIRYRNRPAGGISAEFMPEISSSQDNPVPAHSTLSLDPNIVPDSAFDETVEVTGTYNIES